MQVTNCMIIDQMTSKIYAIRKNSVITVFFMSLASSRESRLLNEEHVVLQLCFLHCPTNAHQLTKLFHFEIASH